MKFLIVFALALATTSAFDLSAANIESHNVAMPVLKLKGRITNGKTASVGQLPYLVSVYSESSLRNQQCGGSLIGNEWVLTAAHCLDGMNYVNVYLGITVLESAEVTYKVDKSNIIIHSGYNKKYSYDDIALIKIPFVSYSANIQPVKIPAMASSYSTYSDEYGIASGWGYISDEGLLIEPESLQWARMQVIPNTLCTETFPFIASFQICVSTPGAVSTCEGDSGGPLVLESSNVQIGVAAFVHPKGCKFGYPAVFMRLTSYLDWIKLYTGISY